MKDETFVFVSDVREKKDIARSSHHKRTHTGKGGAVKFPSDFLSRKEVAAMSSEVKSYRLNEPMKWKEFKAMPDDIKIIYINAIRNKYRVPDTKIYEMLGICVREGCREINRLGIGRGKGCRSKNPDLDGWCMWVNGISNPVTTNDTNSEVVESVIDLVEPEQIEECGNVAEDDSDVQVFEGYTESMKAPITPTFGTMTFEGDTRMALETIGFVLGDSSLRLTVTWERIEVDKA